MKKERSNMGLATIQLGLQKAKQNGDTETYNKLQKTTNENIQSQGSIFNNTSIDKSENDINESEKFNEPASEDLSLMQEIHNALDEHSEEIAANIEYKK